MDDAGVWSGAMDGASSVATPVETSYRRRVGVPRGPGPACLGEPSRDGELPILAADTAREPVWARVDETPLTCCRREPGWVPCARAMHGGVSDRMPWAMSRMRSLGVVLHAEGDAEWARRVEPFRQTTQIIRPGRAGLLAGSVLLTLTHVPATQRGIAIPAVLVQTPGAPE